VRLGHRRSRDHTLTTVVEPIHHVIDQADYAPRARPVS
jgi:hypothetical protein